MINSNTFLFLVTGQMNKVYKMNEKMTYLVNIYTKDITAVA